MKLLYLEHHEYCLFQKQIGAGGDMFSCWSSTLSAVCVAPSSGG